MNRVHRRHLIHDRAMVTSPAVEAVAPLLRERGPAGAILAVAAMEYGYREGGQARVTGLERWVCLSRRAIGRRLRLDGFPTPNDLMRVGALLRLREAMERANTQHGAGPLCTTGAAAARFSSVFTASNMAHHVVGRRPSEFLDLEPADLVRAILEVER